MIYLDLFLTFLKIGAVSFGGGAGMISLIRETVIGKGWLTEPALLNLIAVSESTPGPIAVNVATFIGASQGGIFGSLAATLGVVLPSFFIILLIAAAVHNLLRFAGVQAFLSGVRPCVVGMILATAIGMLLLTMLGLPSAEGILPDYRGMLLFCLLFGISALFRRLCGKKPTPILLILISAGLGILFYGL